MTFSLFIRLAAKFQKTVDTIIRAIQLCHNFKSFDLDLQYGIDFIILYFGFNSVKKIFSRLSLKSHTKICICESI